MNWDSYKARYKALERIALRGGLIGLLAGTCFGVAAGLLGIMETPYLGSRSSHAALLGLICAINGFVLGALVGAICGAWRQ